MTERQAFIRSIIASPDDDLPRLVFADWLDENDEPDRAEYIRVGIEAANSSLTQCPKRRLYRPSLVSVDRLVRCGECQFCTHMRRLEELQTAGVVDEMPFGFAHTAEHPDSILPANEWVTLFYRRGFVYRADMPAAAFTVENVRVLFSAHPVTEIRIPGKRPQQENHADRNEPSVWTWYIGDALWETSHRHVTTAIWREMGQTWYKSEGDATTAFSRACVAWARYEADRYAGSEKALSLS